MGKLNFDMKFESTMGRGNRGNRRDTLLVCVLNRKVSLIHLTFQKKYFNNLNLKKYFTHFHRIAHTYIRRKTCVARAATDRPHRYTLTRRFILRLTRFDP